ncbi:MAG: hypothetical protein DRN68_01125 [Thaumarchaeota archaeon]|nr:MAG: hypothetical protein DRN68_01125 [Nitrososphaerota archaeon]
MRELSSKIIKSVLFICLLILSWEILARSEIVPSYLFPSSSAVFMELIEATYRNRLAINYAITTIRVLVGFGAGTALGLFMGSISISISKLREFLYPIVSFLSVIPAVALVPLLMIWVGMNEALPLLTVMFCSSIPLFYNIISGARQIDKEILEVARTLGANRKKILRDILLPQLAPSILSALKLEAGMAWRTCFVAEMLAMGSGLGYMIIDAESTLNVSLIMALILILSLSCYAFQTLFEMIELRIMRRWGAR